MTTPAPSPLALASLAQRQASAPTHSVWVGASAGTGKTKVLTDRVLRLLLAGTLPGRILCLTFTKAAAAEMANRLHQRLARWATLDDLALQEDLRALGAPDDDRSCTTARRLFASVLDAPGGLAIQTIHAFCQSLLRRFPLEAGLAPHFQAMEESDAATLLTEARDTVLCHARLERDSSLARALADVTALISETTFPDVIAALIRDRGQLRVTLERQGGLAGLAQRLRTQCDIDSLPRVDTADSADLRIDLAAMLHQACTDDACAALDMRRLIEPLLGGSATDQSKAEVMAAFLAADPAQRVGLFESWREIFLTDKGTIRKTLCTKAALKNAPDAGERMQREAERLLQLQEQIGAARLYHATMALLSVGQALLSGYQRRKEARALLDYDDLILTAVDLLQRPGLSAWVLYKLDGGLDHVLIDEAQDTNPDQWAVIRALTEEFFAGQGRYDTADRTIFAVGDAKQSIYSFQRADPRGFEAMRHRLTQIVPAAGGQWADIALTASFRSTAAVLAVVDQVFAGGTAGADGVVPTGQTLHHVPVRAGAAGRVEIWPLLRPQAHDDPPAWKPPVERRRGDSPRARLAKLMALRIHAMITQGERLDSQDRPIRPGDILVLVRRRNALVDELVRALKSLNVPVAGADRMILTEQLAVMDLIALGQMLLLPEDDLTLACVLKSPLVGLSEEDLFRLAHHRPEGMSLWEALRRRADEPPFAAIWAKVSGWLALADGVPPHDLFARVLDEGGRTALLARLGAEAEDPLDEFMSLTLTFETLNPPSLQGFLHWLENGGVEIKRDLDSSGGAVRIMTVHGAKGLQAPIVFLPDTTQVPNRLSSLLWLDQPELPLWAARAEIRCALLDDVRDRAKEAQRQEYRRLLYVALTRAEDRLIVCGWTGSRAPADGNWYDLVRGATGAMMTEQVDPFLAQHPDLSEEAVIVQYRCPQTAPPRRGVAEEDAQPPPPMPDWVRRMAPVEVSPTKPLTPSKPDDDEPAARSPLADHLDATDAAHDGGALPRFLRGRLIHKLLQTLPEIPPAERDSAAAAFLARPAWALSPTRQRRVRQEVMAILTDPTFAPLFAPGSRAEVPLAGVVGRRVLSGVVDRLVVTATDVLIIDYKTNRPPPQEVAAVPALYLRQMAAYRAALAMIYPHHQVRCALLWTDDAALMELPAAMMDEAAAAIGLTAGTALVAASSAGH